MSLAIILEFPWFRKWEITTTFYIDLKEWCWFDHYKVLGSNGNFFEFDVSVLCFTFIVEGSKA